MLWIGERTRQPDGAHVEFFAGVHNPLGVKLGPAASPRALGPGVREARSAAHAGAPHSDRPHGRAHVREALRRPCSVPCARRATAVVWACDPMHANGIRTASGLKTRRFDAIMGELEGFFTACRAERVWPGGVHLEFTGEDVTECLGGAEEVLEESSSDHAACRSATRA